jgi:hypothetical protein
MVRIKRSENDLEFFNNLSRMDRIKCSLNIFDSCSNMAVQPMVCFAGVAQIFAG